MSEQPPAWVARAQTAAAQNKKVLVVEGTTDEAVYREWIAKKLGATWANLVHLETAQDRPRMLSGLRWLQENDDPLKDVVFGLADRDEWEQADVAALQNNSPTLLVNQSRHSLQSYFCVPEEIESILSHRDAESGASLFGPHLQALRQQLETARTDYVPHWALSCTIQRANEKVRRDALYPIFFRNTCPLPSDEDVRVKLQEWADILAPNALFNAFDHLRTESLARPLAEQFQSCVEPKLFFGRIVVAGPHGLNSIQRKSSDDWLIELARWSPAMPADLEVILAPLLL